MAYTPTIKLNGIKFMNSKLGPPKKISKIFITFLPQILTMKKIGYTDDEIVDFLATQDFQIKKLTFKKYLHRNKINNPNNQNLDNKTANTQASPISNEDRKPSKLALTAFGSPEHRAEVQAETEKYFRNSSLKVGLGLNKGNKK